MVGLDRSAVSRIVQNTKFGEMHNLLTQGRDMDYIDLLKDSGWEITHIIDCPMSLRAGGHATVSGKHRSPDAKKPNPGDRSTFPDYSKKEVIFKFGFLSNQTCLTAPGMLYKAPYGAMISNPHILEHFALDTQARFRLHFPPQKRSSYHSKRPGAAGKSIEYLFTK